MSRHILLDGKIFPSDRPSVMHNCAGFTRGDSFTFAMRGFVARCFLIDDYYKFMLHAMQQRGLPVPPSLSLKMFVTDIDMLLQKNRIYRGFTAVVTVFRNAAGQTSVLVATEPADRYYSFGDGVTLCVLDSYRLPEIAFERGELFKALLQPLLPTLYGCADDTDFVLIDSGGNVVKTLQSSLLLVKDEVVISPARLIDDESTIFLRHIINMTKAMGLDTASASLTMEQLLRADEILLIDIQRGVQWVKGLGERRFYNKVAHRIYRSLCQSDFFRYE